MMRLLSRNSFVSLALVLLLRTPVAIAAEDTAFFEAKVRPILVEHCFKCHGPAKQKGGLRLDNLADLLKGGETGAGIVPGKPDESLLIQAVRYQDLEMPPSGKLSDDQIAILSKWVKEGAKWPAEKKSAQGTGHAARKPGLITDEDRAWWAFQPAKPVNPPAIRNDWVKTPIDQFILEKQIAAKVSPTPEAEKLSLLRRVKFDLTGLPPTAEEIDAFLADTSTDAYEKLVDRLLASPAYGERQARFWLDLVRYAESDGYRIDHPRPFAYRYRDYVVESFNQDKPYDRFVQEQLAGDELFPDDPQALIATGFMRHGPYEYNQRDVRGQWSAIVNDITDVTSDLFMGLGFGCARCHDHKFDPILQKDYFALQSFFGGITFRNESVFPTSDERANYEAKLASWEAKTASLRQQMDQMLDAIRKKEMKIAANRFPFDIQAIFAKSREQRTAYEQQLYELAYRQVDYEYERAPSKLGKAKAEYEALKKQLDAFNAEKPIDPTAMIVRDLGPVAEDAIIPGSRKKAVSVEPAFPTVLGDSLPQIQPSATSSMRRATLAKWLTRPDHPLTARVLVNRIWQQHFGRGIVATPSDYGTLGEKPTHPELLDWLTRYFISEGWKLKPLHRLIVTSAVYRQGYVKQPADPENRLYSRMLPRRLDAEQVRDSMLTASGELKLDLGGSSVQPTQPRRSIYIRVHRNDLDPLLSCFDVADGLGSCARRNITVTPTQSLMLLNGGFSLARAKAFAKRVMPENGADAPNGIRLAYQLVYGRPPSESETADALTFLKHQVGATAGKVTPASRFNGWVDFCHALLNSNEFLYVD